MIPGIGSLSAALGLSSGGPMTLGGDAGGNEEFLDSKKFSVGGISPPGRSGDLVALGVLALVAVVIVKG